MGPKGVAVDKNGHIITVDNKACCVFIFQSNGKLVTKFGGRGTSDRQFAGEHGAWTDHLLTMTPSLNWNPHNISHNLHNVSSHRPSHEPYV